jgi:hypothetical protein
VTPVKVSQIQIDNKEFLLLDIKKGKYEINKPFILSNINFIKKNDKRLYGNYKGKKFIIPIDVIIENIKYNKINPSDPYAQCLAMGAISGGCIIC